MTEKLKSWLLDDAVFYTLLVVSVAIVAFVLGRNSLPAPVTQSAGVQISQSSSSVPVTADRPAVAVVVSRSGTKYHLPNCSGAQRIKASNKITFSTIAAAQAAGYSAAANCPGLE